MPAWRDDTGTRTRGRRIARERRGRDRRVLAVGLALSFLLHLLVLGVLGGLLNRSAAPDAADPGRFVAVPPSGMRAVDLVELPADAVERPDVADPTPVRDPETSAPIAAAPAAEAEREPIAADDLSAADRLAPRVVDPRLWRPMVILPGEPTIEDVERRVAAAVELLSDSALAEAERAVRARDWTVKDADGGRWGISPGKLHLGKLTLPLPISFPTSLEAEDEAAMYYDLRNQMDRVRLLESFEARVKAIRERRDRERSERKTDENGGNRGA